VLWILDRVKQLSSQFSQSHSLYQRSQRRGAVDLERECPFVQLSLPSGKVIDVRVEVASENK
jgi:hypothetical protein